MKWVLGKRVIDSLRFLFNNPIIFLVCIPIALLGRLNVYISFQTATGSLLAILYSLLMLFFTSFIFTFIVFKTAYYETKKKTSFKQCVDLSLKNFKTLFISELLLIIALKIFSDLINALALIWTSNFTIALLIVISILFVVSLVKVLLFLPSCVLKGNFGFKESWKITTMNHAIELAILIMGYMFIMDRLSYLPYVGYLINFLILMPLTIIIITLLYLDYLKR